MIAPIHKGPKMNTLFPHVLAGVALVLALACFGAGSTDDKDNEADAAAFVLADLVLVDDSGPGHCGREAVVERRLFSRET
jgi:hypothetical protein